jgi:hypothetical protein
MTLVSENNTVQVRSQKHRIQITFVNADSKARVLDILQGHYLIESGLPDNMIGVQILNPINWENISESIAYALESIGFDVCRIAAPNNGGDCIVSSFIE